MESVMEVSLLLGGPKGQGSEVRAGIHEARMPRGMMSEP